MAEFKVTQPVDYQTLCQLSRNDHSRNEVWSVHLTCYANDMQYTVLIPSSSPAPKINASDQGVAAGVKLLNRSLKWLQNWGFEKNVRAAIESETVQKEIAEKMPLTGGGVLCVIAYDEWAVEDVSGFKAKTFKYVYVFRGGQSAEKIINEYIAQPKLTSAAPKRWVRKTMFLWVTNDRPTGFINDAPAQDIEKISKLV